MTTTLTYAWADEPSPKLRQAFRHAASTWADVLDLRFVEDGTEVDLRITLDDLFGPGAAEIGGPRMWIDPTLEQRWGGWEPGTYSYFVLVHEIGHTLGLGHRYELSMHESAMSATYVLSPAGRFLNPSTPMAADIEALVPVYGANSTAAGGGTWHRVTDPTGLYTVADAGGERDILDLSSILAPALVDLQSGYVTFDEGYVHGLGMEGVKLGQGADTVILHPGDIVYRASATDTLIALDGEIDRMSRREKRDEGLRGKWWDVDGAHVQGSYKLVDAIVVEA